MTHLGGGGGAGGGESGGSLHTVEIGVLTGQGETLIERDWPEKLPQGKMLRINVDRMSS